MSTAAHKEIVRRYFSEVVDKKKTDILDELWTPDCVVHRPDGPTIIGLENFKRGVKQRVLDVYSEFITTIHDLIAENDLVSCRLSHRAVHRGDWTSRLGRHSVPGRAVNWTSITNFRFRDGKIAEEWVERDELGMLIQLGVVTSSSKPT
jgi:predicted ester cyclase